MRLVEFVRTGAWFSKHYGLALLAALEEAHSPFTLDQTVHHITEWMRNRSRGARCAVLFITCSRIPHPDMQESIRLHFAQDERVVAIRDQIPFHLEFTEQGHDWERVLHAATPADQTILEDLEARLPWPVTA